MLFLFSMMQPGLAQDPPPEEVPVEELPPLVKNPELTDFVQAPFPPEALEAGVEGSVLLVIEIDEAGLVTLVEVLEGAGYGFDEAAVEAAQQFRFSPAEDETGPVPVAIEFEYGFIQDTSEREDAVPIEDAPEVEAPVNLEGQLVEMGTRRPLKSFTVQIEALGLSSETDDEGRFSFRGVPVGEVSVGVLYPGYQTLKKQVEITEGEVTSLKLWMKNLSYRDDEIVGVYQKEKDEITRRTISIAEVRRVPGTFGDPVRVIQNLPGAARPPFGTGLLVIRGANPEDSAVYVDGIRVPIIYHLGGYVSIVNADLIDTVDYLPGGYGVKYGRSTGGVVDIKTKNAFPERSKFTWSTDLLDSGGYLTGRAGKNDNIGFGVGARRSYIDAFIPIIAGETGFFVKPRWYDYQLKLSNEGMDDGRLTGFLFGFQDVLLIETPDDFAQGTDQDTQGDVGVKYQSHRVVSEWETGLSDKTRFYLSPSLGVDYISFGLGQDFNFELNNWIIQTRAELTHTLSDRVSLRPGFDIFVGPYDVGITLPFLPTADDLDPVGERESFDFRAQGMIISPDPFLDIDITPFPDADRDFTISPGIRYNTLWLSADDRSGLAYQDAWDPRLAMRMQVLDNGYLKAGTGFFHQPPQGADFGFNTDYNVDFERAWNSEVGWEQQFTEALGADLTFFRRTLSELIVDNPDFQSNNDSFYVNEGTGRVNGMEVILRHALVDKFFGWISYTLSKSERNNYPERQELSEWIPFDFDQTHIMTAVASYRLPRDWEISSRFQYVTGNPYTPLDGGVYDIDQDSYIGFATGDTNSARFPDYLALDFRVDKLFTFKRWQLEVYLDLLNTVRGENPEDIQYNYDYTDSVFVRGLPFIPSPGFQADFEF